MGIVFAPEQVFDDVVDRFALEHAGGGFDLGFSDGFAIDSPHGEVLQFFGWRKRSKHKDGQSRIVWVPGDDGNAGEVVAPRINHDARQLATLEELVTVYVAGYDPTNPTSERAQYNATRALFDAWYRAVHHAAVGTFRIESLRWMVPRTELPHGVELRCVFSVQAPIPDAPYAFAPADTTADIDTSLDDVTEKTVASPAP